MSVVTVLVRGSAFESRRAAEAMRMSVGQTLGDHDVRLVLAEDAVYTLNADARPAMIAGGDVQRPIETLRMLGKAMYAESESLDARDVAELPAGVERIARADLAGMLAESDVVLTW
ncbi:DsrE family protein [Candidatus Poribacteria bacterium]|jgi:sulfur relay (sulfurtransferase) DsrF/TusC family protein|nr:DsrE family protein [Candidatus Poribacteria bacterium]MBT5536126.1 DsrE family protein [Candidatus Poribacteria bacterium]MBT5714379.1 DsrE family protein [Candidatus Poribacteria bacterium]MBT7097560.1 DsrE family protein [Candidatus Poribacteria bacterium]MBT7804877.1 DsrE family protein [Candidatus Poribacteria bacterium]